ncbi:MAG: glycosyltransferase family 4 protein [Cyclobacteriaceae bacterium]
MKIAIVLNTSWNIYNFRMNFVRNLQEQGHEIHTIAPRDEYTKYLIEAGCIHHDVKMDSRGANPIKDTALFVELFLIYRKLQPDVILHYTVKPNVFGSLAAGLLGIPAISNVCGLGTVFLKKNIISAIAILLYKISFRFPRKIFFQNPEDLDLFLRLRLAPRKSADLVPGSGIDLNHFTPADYRRNKEFTFLLISRLITDKGVLEYVEAVKKLRSQGISARFQILGAKDPQHKRSIRLSELDEWSRNGTIEYLGTTDDVRHFIHNSDCIVLPSYREGTPRTLLEAASSGKPIIATDVPGCRQVVTDNYNGFLCKVKDADDLARKMKTMTSLDDQTLVRLGKNGRKKVESEFDEMQVITKYFQAIQGLKKAS